MLAGVWQNFKTETLSADDASGFLLPWQELVGHAAEPSGFNAPELILPILKHVGGATLSTVAIGADLLFALPVAQSRSFNSSWVNPLSAGGVPHVSGGLLEETLTAFIRNQTKPFLFQAIAADGPLHQQIKKVATHYAVLDSWQRAGLKLSGSFESWLQTNFDQKRRKEFKRLRNRLSEQGDLHTEILKASDSPEVFVEDFLHLEASGWKGKKGTAIDADPKLAAALREATRKLHHAGKLRFWNMKLNGKSIASLYAIVEGDQAWLGKIAYDESFAKYSPGALIILDCTESFFAEKNIKQVDSCAIPGHPLIDRIWRDRLPINSVFVASSIISELSFNLVVSIARLRHKWRSRLRDLYYLIKRKKRS